MSEGNTANPRIWLNADVWVAPVGTTAPIYSNFATPMSTISPLWTALGLLSQDDGMTETRDQDSTDHYAWGNILVRNTRAKIKFSFQVTALEDNAAVFGLVYPGSTSVTNLAITTRTVKVPTVNTKSFCFEMTDGSIKSRRYIPTGEVSEIADISINDSEMAAKQLTISVYPSGAGIAWYDMTNDTQ